MLHGELLGMLDDVVSPQLNVKYSSRLLPPRKSDRMYVDWLHMGRVGREAPAGLQTMRGIT